MKVKEESEKVGIRLGWPYMAWLIVSLIRQGCGSCDQFDWFSVTVVFILSAL